MRYDLGWRGVAWGVSAYIGSASRITTGLAQCVESQRSLNPTETPVDWLADGGESVCIAAVKTRLATVPTFSQLLNALGPLANPEFALGRAARKDDVRKL